MENVPFEPQTVPGQLRVCTHPDGPEEIYLVLLSHDQLKAIQEGSSLITHGHTPDSPKMLRIITIAATEACGKDIHNDDLMAALFELSLERLEVEKQKRKIQEAKN